MSAPIGKGSVPKLTYWSSACYWVMQHWQVRRSRWLSPCLASSLPLLPRPRRCQNLFPRLKWTDPLLPLAWEPPPRRCCCRCPTDKSIESMPAWLTPASDQPPHSGVWGGAWIWPENTCLGPGTFKSVSNSTFQAGPQAEQHHTKKE